MKNHLITLDKELLNDESVLWMGMPIKNKLFNRIDALLIPLGFIWSFGGIIYEKMALDNMLLSADYSILEQLISIIPFIIVMPVVIIGFYLLFVRFLIKTYIKNKILYAITTQRIFVIYNGFHKRIKNMNIGLITNMETSTNKRGIGSINFYKINNIAKAISIIWLEIPFIYYHSNRFAFYDTADVDKVTEIINRIKKELCSRKPYPDLASQKSSGCNTEGPNGAISSII